MLALQSIKVLRGQRKLDLDQVKTTENFLEVELALTESLGRKVKVTKSKGKGTLEIEFYSREDLADLANRLGAEEE